MDFEEIAERMLKKMEKWFDEYMASDAVKSIMKPTWVPPEVSEPGQPSAEEMAAIANAQIANETTRIASMLLAQRTLTVKEAFDLAAEFVAERDKRFPPGRYPNPFRHF